MFLPLGIVFALGLLFLIAGIRWSRHRHLRQFIEPISPARRGGFQPSLFDQPARWLAIRGHDPEFIQETLGIQNAVRCSWEEGLSELREQKLFIAPTVGGWILVIGQSLPDPAEDVDKCFHLLSAWSRELGHLQFFSANRILNHHAWAIVDQGAVFRAYAWAGETLWNQGPLTAAEKELNLRCLEYGAARSLLGQKEPFISNTEKVCRLAARWSLDPNVLSDRLSYNRRGIVGHLSQFRPS